MALKNAAKSKPACLLSAGLAMAFAVGGAAVAVPAHAEGNSPAADGLTALAKRTYSGKMATNSGFATHYMTDSAGGKNNYMSYGAYTMKSGSLNGQRVWCIDAGLQTPFGGEYATTPTADKAAKLSYILAKYDKKRTSQQSAWDMAVSQYVHQSSEVKHRDIVKVRSIKAANTFGWGNTDSPKKPSATVQKNAATYSDQIGADATKYYSSNGKYTVKVAIVKDNTQGTKAHAEVKLLNSAGKQVPGFAAKVATTNAKAATTSYTSTTKTFSTTLTGLTAGKKATVKVTFAKLPTNSVNVYKPKDYKSSGYDRYDEQQIVQPRTTSASASATLTPTTPGKPTVTTNISDKTLEPGQKVSDSYTLSGLKDGDTADIVHTLYAVEDKPTESSTLPKDAKVLGTVTSKGVKNGDGTSPTITLPADFHGYVFWTESIAKTDLHDAWQGKYGTPDETGLAPWAPKITTKVQDQRVEAGKPIVDTYAVSGAKDDEKVTAQFDFYRVDQLPTEATDDIPDNAEKIGSVTKDVENGKGTVTGPKATKSGYVVIRESIKKSEDHDEYVSKFGVSDETTVVPWKPSVKTSVTDDSFDKLPAKVADTGEITGGAPNSTVTVSTQAVNTKDAPKQQATIPSDGKVLSTTVQKVKLDADGNGKYKTDELSLKDDGLKPGQHSYVSFVVTIAKDNAHDKYVSKFGENGEVVKVELPPEESKHYEAHTGGYVATVDGPEGMSTAAIIGAIGALLAAAGVTTVLIRRHRKNSAQ